MVRVAFAALVISLLIGFVFPPAFGPVFIILIILIGLANVGKLKCPHCGKRVKLGKSVCHHCGREVRSLLDKAAATQLRKQQTLPTRRRFCSSCGTTLDVQARFCSGCGAPARQL